MIKKDSKQRKIVKAILAITIVVQVLYVVNTYANTNKVMFNWPEKISGEILSSFKYNNRISGKRDWLVLKKQVDFKVNKKNEVYNIYFSKDRLTKLKSSGHNAVRLLAEVDGSLDFTVSEKGVFMDIINYEPFKEHFLQQVYAVSEKYPKAVKNYVVEKLQSKDYRRRMAKQTESFWFYLIKFWTGLELDESKEYIYKSTDSIGNKDVFFINTIKLKNIDRKGRATFIYEKKIAPEDLLKLAKNHKAKYKTQYKVILDASTMLPFYYEKITDIDMPNRKISDELIYEFKYNSDKK
ncbi:MAG: hypothetical protein GY730_05450 [bacterium]|nr:hypothetical protein [bacterium]